ncbi:MAG TPA: hypothetical protein VMR62_14120 [Bryobacteraceae bacterium]|nr:hypothetical protein [Bryobacteraceae bacterium]
MIALVEHAQPGFGWKLVDGCEQFPVLLRVSGRKQMHEHVAARGDFPARQSDFALVATAQGQQFVSVMENHFLFPCLAAYSGRLNL